MGMHGWEIGHALWDDAAHLRKEIDRLKSALEPFAKIGRPLITVGEDVIPDGASARFLKLEPLTAADFKAAARAVDKP